MIQKANLEIFAETLLDLAKKDKEIVVVTSDSRGSGKLTQFGKELPDQIIEVGIAEQNLVGICAGLAAVGKKVFGQGSEKKKRFKSRSEFWQGTWTPEVPLRVVCWLRT